MQGQLLEISFLLTNVVLKGAEYTGKPKHENDFGEMVSDYEAQDPEEEIMDWCSKEVAKLKKNGPDPFAELEKNPCCATVCDVLDDM